MIQHAHYEAKMASWAQVEAKYPQLFRIWTYPEWECWVDEKQNTVSSAKSVISDIFKGVVRPIGIGAIAMAGIIGIIKSSGVIASAFKLAVGVGNKASENEIKNGTKNIR